MGRRQPFPRWSDTLLRWGLLLGASALPAAFVIPGVYLRTPYRTGRQAPQEQPVQFDHRHHVEDDAIPCLYCHTGAETTPYAGIPPTELCMGCHSQIWNDSPMLEPVRRSYFSGQPLAWNRVHWVPDFVFFNHAIHVKRGIDCAQCHGDVAAMATPYKTKMFTMGWCLDCHRKMGRSPVARAEQTTTLSRSEPVYTEHAQEPLDPTMPLTNCTTCHR